MWLRSRTSSSSTAIFFRNHGSFCHQTGLVHSPVAQQFRDFPVQLFIVLLHGFRHQLFHGIGHFRQTIQMKCHIICQTLALSFRIATNCCNASAMTGWTSLQITSGSSATCCT